MEGDFKYEIFEMCLISRSEFDVGKRWEFESEKGGKWWKMGKDGGWKRKLMERREGGKKRKWRENTKESLKNTKEGVVCIGFSPHTHKKITKITKKSQKPGKSHLPSFGASKTSFGASKTPNLALSEPILTKIYKKFTISSQKIHNFPEKNIKKLQKNIFLLKFNQKNSKKSHKKIFYYQQIFPKPEKSFETFSKTKKYF